VSLHSLRGRAVLLEFFATWCPHCAAEAPHLEQIVGSLPRNTYSFVSVDADGETAPSVLAFHIYFGLSYPALLDPSNHAGSFASPGSAGPVTSAYRVRVYPTFYVLDPTGKIVWGGQGEQPDALLRHELLDARAG
jgi:thiol-disulfide isomerase/thioredoxin